MTDLDRFAYLIEGAVSRLQALGIGVILVGPPTAFDGIRRTARDRFDDAWHLPTVDIQNDTEGHAFLLGMLRARDTKGFLRSDVAERLAALSGGVVRDLIAMTQAAGEEAYVDGADRVELHHVETAGENLARTRRFAIAAAAFQRPPRCATFPA
jgi:hypothetical protein